MVLSTRRPGRGERDCRSCFEFFPRKDLEAGLCAECRKEFSERPWLRCGRGFESEGAHNRVCSECRLVNERTVVSRAYAVQGKVVYMDVSRKG